MRVDGDPLLTTDVCSTRRDGVRGAVLTDANITVGRARQVYTPEGPVVEIEILANRRLDWQEGDYLDTETGEHYVIRQIDRRGGLWPVARLTCTYAKGVL